MNGFVPRPIARVGRARADHRTWSFKSEPGPDWESAAIKSGYLEMMRSLFMFARREKSKSHNLRLPPATHV
jgi:hypothetical protein